MSSESRSPSMAAVVAVSFITSAAVSVGVVLGARTLGPEKRGEPETVDVPVVVNMTPSTAGELLEGRGLRLLVAGEQPHSDVARGAISEQSPLAGSRVDQGTEVRVFLSSGTPMASVPTLEGKTLADAEAALESAGLKVGNISEGGSGEGGTISASDPAAGVEVPVGSAVALTQVPAGNVVPELLGMNRRKAKEALETAGFQEGKVKWRFNESKSPFTVLEQDPAPGTTLPPGSSIDLVLNEE